MHSIVPLGASVRYVETDRMRLTLRCATRAFLRRYRPQAEAVVAKCMRIGAFRRATPFLELAGRAEATVRTPALQQHVSIRDVTLEPVRLVIRALVPREPEPRHALQDGRRMRVTGPLAVRILDAQHEHAAMAARKQPVEQRRARSADVQVARR